VSAFLIVEVAEDCAEAEKTRRGGSVLTEKTEVTVIATGPSPASAVTTATPAGWFLNANLKRSASNTATSSGGLIIPSPIIGKFSIGISEFMVSPLFHPGDTSTLTV
jgi:hypothetical protein